jgi:YbbR domain-containing protein
MRMLTENIGWKVLSLAAAVLLWVGLVGEAEIATSIPIVVQFRNAPQDLEITSQEPGRLFLRVRGPSNLLKPASLAGTSLELDLSTIHGPGEQTFTIDKTNLNLPAGVSMLRVVPSQVRVELQRRTSKQVPVEVRFSGPPPRGYRIASQSVKPARVAVIGPESKVEQTNVALTDAISLNSTVGDANFKVPLYVPDPNVRFQDEPVANVEIRLEKIQ